MGTTIVTGANRGIGLCIAKELAARGERVVMVARDRRAGEAAVAAVAEVVADVQGEAVAGRRVELVVGDLSTVASTRALAAALLDACPTVDALVHNAGVWPAARAVNEDGLETAFALNHVAPFVLNHLLEARLAASGARVVQVSAGLYVKGHVDLARTPTGEDFHAIRTYASTKLANLLVAPLFARRWKGSGITVNAVHPGVLRTDLGARGGVLGALLRAVKLLWKPADAGAPPVVRLALDASRGGVADGLTGKFFMVDQETELAPIARDETLALALWKKTAAIAGLDAGVVSHEDDRAGDAHATTTEHGQAAAR